MAETATKKQRTTTTEDSPSKQQLQKQMLQKQQEEKARETELKRRQHEAKQQEAERQAALAEAVLARAAAHTGRWKMSWGRRSCPLRLRSARAFWIEGLVVSCRI